MNMLGFLRMFKRKVNMPDMPSQQVDAMNSLMKPRRITAQTDPTGALGQFKDTTIPKQNMPLSQQELDELLYGDFNPAITAAERARLMEMQTPTGAYDDAGVMSLEELKRNPEISRPQRTSVFYDE
jgi:hypothetical protein